MTQIKNNYAGYLLSAVSAEVTGMAQLDLRATNGHFLLWTSGSSNGPTAGASAIIQVQHSHNTTGWTNLGAVFTASAGGVYTASYSAGAYGYLRSIVTKCYSAAQTGTGTIYQFVQPGMP